MKKKTTTQTKNQYDPALIKKVEDLIHNRRREWRFDLPLTAAVEGKTIEGKPFQELTTLDNISSGGAHFHLESGVTVGTRLSVIIDLPQKLTDRKDLKLMITGTAVRIQKSTQKGKKQGVALTFDEEYQFIPNPDDK